MCQMHERGKARAWFQPGNLQLQSQPAPISDGLETSDLHLDIKLGPLSPRLHAPFRVIGVQLSHLSRTGQFVFCTFGVFFFLLIYGALQEYMVMFVFNRHFSTFLTLCQFAGYAAFAAVHRLVHEDNQRRIPYSCYILLSVLQATNQGLTNLSMRWLNYPAKMLFKSSRIIPTMMVGVMYMRKHYHMRDYVVVCLMSLGLVAFIQGDARTSPSFHPLGILSICAALAVDAAIVNLQEWNLRRYDATHDELIFYSYGLGSIVLFLTSLVTGELRDGVAFLHQRGLYPSTALLVFCSCGYFGVTCVAALTKKFGALPATMTSTSRKAVTLFLSFFIFPKPATSMHCLGGLIFATGLLVKTLPALDNLRNYSRLPLRLNSREPRPFKCERWRLSALLSRIGQKADSGLTP